MSKHLIIFDTTMRDGEQSPGASMNLDEKVRIAKVLEKMRVDVIEAGFPVASPGDFEAVKAVCEAVSDTTVCALARALDSDIERAQIAHIMQSGHAKTALSNRPDVGCGGRLPLSPSVPLLPLSLRLLRR